MAHLNCATCTNPQSHAWHAHQQRMPMNMPGGEWGNQFNSQQQLNRSNLSLNVGAGYMLPHHHGAGGMMAPPPVFMNQAGMMAGMYPYPYNAGMPVMNPGKDYIIKNVAFLSNNTFCKPLCRSHGHATAYTFTRDLKSRITCRFASNESQIYAGAAKTTHHQLC